jgi:hypothetical protein
VRQIGKAKKQDPPVKRMNVNLPPELHNSFKSITAAQGQNMTDVLIQFVREYVDRHSVKLKGRRP